MKIHFSKKEYLMLLDMIYLSDWIMHAHDTEHKSNGYKDLRKKLLSFYEEMGAEERVEYSKESGDYFETRDYEEKLHEKYIEPYDEENFWEELIERLSARDVVKQIGKASFEKMDWMERTQKIDEAAERYVNEFEHDGLKNLGIIREKECIN